MASSNSTDTYLIEQTAITKERALLVGLYGQQTPRTKAEEYLEELALLTDTAGGTVLYKVIQNRDKPHIGTYVGKGKLEELKALIKAESIDIIIFDDDLTPTQTRNIERETEIKVLDRSGLILDIFASRAKSSTAKTQVELAQLQYILPRLTRMWTHLSRQKGGIGTKGPGETQIETDRRIIKTRIATLREKLEKLEKQRATQRQGREKHPRVALVGYTNAGKSSLMNTLVEAGVLAEDRLFATLDSTMRRLEIGNRILLLSDTVGFIRKLPHNLVESFKSTLDEIREADLLLHVVDAASPYFEEYIQVVRQTLKEIGAEDKNELLVFNKVDLLEEPYQFNALQSDYPEALCVSAHRGIGMEQLREALVEQTAGDLEIHTLRIPVSNSRAIAYIHENADVEMLNYQEDVAEIRFEMHRKYAGKLMAMLHY
ncbi:MAG: GTP-binding protein HflX [Bacteroidetes bacterium HLUCCA01]|nr:MAG: GTP-binding protein HflX [Bacteroidetes bacterium HLUCCA01]